MGVDTAGLWSFRSCTTLVFAATAGWGWLGAAARLFGTGAIEESVTAGTTPAAVVWVETGTALKTRGLVEVEADQVGAAGLSAGVLVRAVILLVVWTRADRTMWLSDTTEGDCPKLKDDGVPQDAEIVCSATSKLLVVREPS